MADATSMLNARPELEQLAEDAFSFLVTDKGWSRGRTEKTAVASTFYFKPARFVAALGLEVLIDVRDESVDVNLVKLGAGKAPAHRVYETESGMVRRPLERLLPEVLRVQDRRLDAVSALQKSRKPWDRATAESLLRAYGELVATYIDRLLQQPVEILFPRSRTRAR